MQRSIGTLALLLVAAAGARGQVLADSYFGAAGTALDHVDVIGDLNGDGCNEYVIGASSDSSNGPFSGIVRIRDGKSGDPVRVHSGVANSFFGFSSADLGDVNGDQVSDYAIGAWGESSYAGSVTLFSGATGAVIKKTIGAPGAQFGFAIAGLPDVNGDFIREILVGAPGESKAHVMTTAGTIIKTVSDSQSNSRFGVAVARVGDLDGDSKDDFVVGAPLKNDVPNNRVDAGSVTCFTHAGIFLREIYGSSADMEFGAAVAGIDGIGGSGQVEFLVGAPGFDFLGVTDLGLATLVDGTTGTKLFSVFGDDAGDRLGTSVDLTPDLNGDGVADLVCGAPGHDPDGDLGYAATFSGADGAAFHTYSFSFDWADRYCGAQVSGGDINGDGIGDVLVSCPGYDYAGSMSGAANVYHGAPALAANYGQGLAGSNGVPTIAAQGVPVLGQPMSVYVGNSANSGTIGVLLIGLQQLDLPTSKLGHLLVQPLIVSAMYVPINGLSVNGTLPNDDALANVDAYLQFLLLDAGAAKGLAFTDGLDLHLGFQY